MANPWDMEWSDAPAAGVSEAVTDEQLGGKAPATLVGYKVPDKKEQRISYIEAEKADLTDPKAIAGVDREIKALGGSAPKPWQRDWEGVKEEKKDTSIRNNKLVTAAAIGDVVAGIPGMALGTVAGLSRYTLDLSHGDSHKEASAAALKQSNELAEAFPTTGMFKNLIEHYTEKSKDYDESAVNKAMEKISSWADKGGKWVEKKTKGVVTEEDFKLGLQVAQLAGPKASMKLRGVLKEAKPSLTPVEVASGKVEPTTASKLLEAYEKSGADMEGMTKEKIAELAELDLKADKVVQQGMKGEIPKEHFDEVVKHDPLVKEKVQEITGKKSPGGLIPKEGLPPEELISRMEGKVDPKLLFKLAATGSAAALGANLAEDEKLEGAIVGGVAGLLATSLPSYAAKISDSWGSALKSTAKTAAVTAGLAYADTDHPIEGALIGLALGGRKLLPRAKVPKIGDMSADDIGNMRNGNLASQAREISIVSGGIKTLVPEPARRAEVSHAVESGDLSKLTDAERKAANIYKGFTKSYGEAAKDAGVLQDFVENYVTHVVEKEGLPKGKVAEILDNLGLGDKLPPAGVKSGYAKHRKYDTFAELESAIAGSGLRIKTFDVAEIAEIYGKSMGRAVENKKYIDAMKAGKDGAGKPFIQRADRAPADFVDVKSSQLAGLKVHPELADAMKFILEGANPGAVTKGLLAASLGSKRLATSLSLFHGMNLGNAAVMATGRGPLYLKGAIDAAHKVYKEGGLGDATDTLLKEGLQLSSGRPIEFDAQALAKVGALIDSATNKIIGTGVKAEKILGGVEKLQTQTFDRITWEYLHTGLKLAVGLREFERLTLKHPELPKEQVARQVAAYTNDTFGGLDWYRVAQEADSALGRKVALSMLSPRGRVGLQIGMFAPDWGFSTFRATYKALPGDTKTPLNKSLHQRYVARTAFTYFTLLNGINMQLSGHPIWENKDPFKLENADGTTIQALKHAMEFPESVARPRQTILNKLGPLPQEGIEQVLGKDRLSADGKAQPLQSRVAHALKRTIPMALQGDNVEGRSAMSSLGRSLGSEIGVNVYGLTKEEKEATADKRKRDRRLKELREGRK